MSEKQHEHQKNTTFQELEQRCLKAEKELAALQSRNQLLGESAPLGIFIINSAGDITGINRKMVEIYPWEFDEKPHSISLLNRQKIIAADISAEVEQCILKQQSVTIDRIYIDHQSTQGAAEVINSNYEFKSLRYNLNPICSDDGTVTEVMAIVEDCTEIKKGEIALKDSAKRYRQLYESTPIAMVETDATSLISHLDQLKNEGISDFREYLDQHPEQIEYCWSLVTIMDQNPAYVELMNIDRCAFPQESNQKSDSNAYNEMVREIILAIAERKTVNEREMQLITVTGEKKFVLGKSMIVSGYQESYERILIALIDISERRRAEMALIESEKRFKDLSFQDNLTGLFNQRYLYMSLAGRIESAQRSNEQLSLIFMDLDHFKHVVDTHGHLNGSRAIREVARTIRSCLQTPAYGVAYAGDEFVVVLPGFNRNQAFLKADEIRTCMRDTTYVLDQNVEICLQASFGIATFPEDAQDVDALLSAADQALFAVKTSKKNGILQYTDLK